MESLQDKLRQLKENQQERVNRSFEYFVDEWEQMLKIRRLTMADNKRAEQWAKKNFRKKAEAAHGVALICLAVLDDALPLTVENVNFLLEEPVPVVKGLIGYVNEISEILDEKI